MADAAGWLGPSIPADEYCIEAPGSRSSRTSSLSAAGRNTYDRDLTDLVGELSTHSDEFRQHWARHDVRFHISGVKRYHHARVGDFELNYERLEVVSDTGLSCLVWGGCPILGPVLRLS